MSYTVGQLAKLAKVSVRTLHHYDEIGLLKPSFHAVNGYRMYEKEELLKLQQILFFRELGFELEEIKKVVGAKNFSQMQALSKHKSHLQSVIRRYKQLVKTIDKTMKHLKGEETMTDPDIYHGFSEEKQKEYEDYLVDSYGESAKKLIDESKKRTSKFKKQDYENIRLEFDSIAKDLIDAINQGLLEDSEKVQMIVKRHYQVVSKFYEASKELYIGLGDIYVNHPDFKKMFDGYDPRLADFLKKAMKVFAEHSLS